jgi:hypothetical protein
MRCLGVLLATLALSSCGSLPTTEDGVAFLEVIPPNDLTIDIGETVRITARALDASGNPVDVPIIWLSADTTVSVDETGLVTGRFAGRGRVQARIGGNDRLISGFIEITVNEPEAEPPPEEPEPARSP